MVQLDSLSALKDRIGEEIGISDWLEITQERINQFAEATEDRQWIHVDTDRAKQSPFRTTIAHGFLTLSLLSVMGRTTFTVSRLRMAINYGLNKVRFVAPAPVNSRVRGRFSPISVEDAGAATDVIWSVTIEREGGEKPCVVAEWIVRYYTNRDRGAD